VLRESTSTTPPARDIRRSRDLLNSLRPRATVSPNFRPRAASDASRSCLTSFLDFRFILIDQRPDIFFGNFTIY
jgi:hypothetical protein